MHPTSAREEILSHGWVQHVELFEEIDSTNAAARRALQTNSTHRLGSLKLPALFIAERQTAGRGRNSRVWWSPSGCLMLTLVLPSSSLPNDPSQWSQLALVCGQAVAHTAANWSPRYEMQLKWPNDVYANDRKVAGILIESAPGGNWLIGIGLNIDVDWQQAPLEIARKATCLSTLAGRKLAPSAILVELIEELHCQVLGWQGGDSNWLNQWRQRCLLTGRVVQVRLAPEQQVVGFCEGLDDTGRLIVRDENSVQFLSAGEVVAWQ